MLQIVSIVPAEAHLHGATLAQQHVHEVMGQLSGAPTHPSLLVLDFGKATSVTASYLRGTLLWAILCGQSEIDKKVSVAGMEPGAIRPIPLFASTMKCSDDVASDIHDFFSGRGLPILEILEMSPAGPVSSRLLGQLDPLLFRTLQQVADHPDTTAAELSERARDEITVNAWSNRLSDLYRFRLLTRRRDGKFWRYTALSQSISIWA